MICKVRILKLILMGLLNGKKCLEYGCFKCCLETEMILSYSDIHRIIKLGYKLDEFAYFDGHYWRLRNNNRRCYFLSNDGRCRIYKHRPKGCMAYPVIIIESEKEIRCGVDDYCPFSNKINLKELRDGCKILIELFRELGEKIIVD